MKFQAMLDSRLNWRTKILGCELQLKLLKMTLGFGLLSSLIIITDYNNYNRLFVMNYFLWQLAFCK